MAEHSHEGHSHHIIPVRTYLITFAGLMILLALTLGVAFINFGAFDKTVTVAVAAVKASVIMLFFMGLRYSNGLVWIFATLGFFFLVIMLLIAMGDYVARQTIPGDEELIGLITVAQSFIG